MIANLEVDPTAFAADLKPHERAMLKAIVRGRPKDFFPPWMIMVIPTLGGLGPDDLSDLGRAVAELLEKESGT